MDSNSLLRVPMRLKKLFSSDRKHVKDVQIDGLSGKKLEHLNENLEVMLPNIFHFCVGSVQSPTKGCSRPSSYDT